MCCPFLSFVVERDGGSVTLLLTAPPGAEPLLEALLVTLDAGASPPTRADALGVLRRAQP